MSEDSSPVRVQLKLEHLLWRTRGRHWDYLFLVEPDVQYGQDWYSLYKQIFADTEPRAESERYILGELLDEQGQPTMTLLGTVFLDDSRRDAFGRSIAHYMVWLRPNKDLHEVKESIPQDWGHAVLSRVGYALDNEDVFNVVSDDYSVIRRAFERALTATNWTMELEGPNVDPAECRDVGGISEEPRSKLRGINVKKLLQRSKLRGITPVARKKAQSIVNSTSSPLSGGPERCFVDNPDNPKSSPASSNKDWKDDIKRAITQGEAWALLHDRGPLVRNLPSLSLMLQKMKDADALQRLVKSFSGSQDDKFILARAELLSRRVRTSYLPEPSKSKGFDAVVDTFVRHGRHLELNRLGEDEACASLVQQIEHSAATTDLFIHNVYARLRSQAKN